MGFTDGPEAFTLGKELDWHHLVMYSWSSQGALPSAFPAAPTLS